MFLFEFVEIAYYFSNSFPEIIDTSLLCFLKHLILFVSLPILFTVSLFSGPIKFGEIPSELRGKHEYGDCPRIGAFQSFVASHRNFLGQCAKSIEGVGGDEFIVAVGV